MARRANWSTRGPPCGGGADYLLKRRWRRRTRCTCRWATRTRTTGAGSGPRTCMHTPRNVYRVTPRSPGSDVAGETAMAMAAASLVFRTCDPAIRPGCCGAKCTAVIYLVYIVHADSLLSSGASCPVCVYICRRSISRTGTEARTATRSAPWPAPSTAPTPATK
jgi:hypothetical protein